MGEAERTAYGSWLLGRSKVLFQWGLSLMKLLSVYLGTWLLGKRRVSAVASDGKRKASSGNERRVRLEPRPVTICYSRDSMARVHT